MIDARQAEVVAIIEDDREARCALGRLLSAGGFETALFESAESFIRSTADNRWLCLIVDVQLGGISGIDLQRSLRSAGSEIPIIVVTGNGSDVMRERAEQAGCTAFLSKPFSSDIILALVGSLPRQPRT